MLRYVSVMTMFFLTSSAISESLITIYRYRGSGGGARRGGGSANVSSQLKLSLLVSSQLNFGPFVICQLSTWLLIIY